MGGRPGQDDAALTVFETVRCLACGKVYSRVRERNTTLANSGCPHCTYVGWQPLTARLESQQPHFDADLRRSRSGRPR